MKSFMIDNKKPVNFSLQNPRHARYVRFDVYSSRARIVVYGRRGRFRRNESS